MKTPAFLTDPVEELSRQDWRSDPEVVTVDRVIADVTAKRRAAEAELTALDAQQRQRDAETDQHTVAQLLGRAVRSVRPGAKGPTIEARRREAEEVIAATERQLSLLVTERERAVLAAKRRVAEAIEAVARPILTELIPVAEQAYALNTQLARVATISRGQFMTGTAEAPTGAWAFLPEGSSEPAAHHTYPGFDRATFERWRLFLKKQGYR